MIICHLSFEALFYEWQLANCNTIARSFFYRLKAEASQLHIGKAGSFFALKQYKKREPGKAHPGSPDPIPGALASSGRSSGFIRSPHLLFRPNRMRSSPGGGEELGHPFRTTALPMGGVSSLGDNGDRARGRESWKTDQSNSRWLTFPCGQRPPARPSIRS